MNRDRRMKARRISSGLQIGVSSIHVLLAAALLISSIILFFYIFPQYDEARVDEEDENDDENEQTLKKIFDALSRAIVILICYASFIGILIGGTLTALSSYVLVGNFKTLRSNRGRSHVKRNYTLVVIDILIILILLSMNIWIFEDAKTRTVFTFIIAFWILLLCITISHLFILRKTTRSSDEE